MLQAPTHDVALVVDAQGVIRDVAFNKDELALELDGQGRIVIPQKLRESASIRGEVRVFGRINHLEVWNEELFTAKLASEPWTDEDGLSLAEYGI